MTLTEAKTNAENLQHLKGQMLNGKKVRTIIPAPYHMDKQFAEFLKQAVWTNNIDIAAFYSGAKEFDVLIIWETSNKQVLNTAYYFDLFPENRNKD